MLSLLTKSHRITSLARCQFNSSSALKTPSRSMSESSCIFCKIVNKTAEANILHEVNTGGLETVWQCDSVTGLFRTRGCLCSQTEAQLLSTTTLSSPRLSSCHLTFLTTLSWQEHIVDIRALGREDIPLVKEMEEVGLGVLRTCGGDMSSVLTGFHWPIQSVSHLHMHIIAPADDMRVLNRIVFSRMFFGSTQRAIEMLQNK